MGWTLIVSRLLYTSSTTWSWWNLWVVMAACHCYLWWRWWWSDTHLSCYLCKCQLWRFLCNLIGMLHCVRLHKMVKCQVLLTLVLIFSRFSLEGLQAPEGGREKQIKEVCNGRNPSWFVYVHLWNWVCNLLMSDQTFFIVLALWLWRSFRIHNRSKALLRRGNCFGTLSFC
jgi:hypothetical protein